MLLVGEEQVLCIANTKWTWGGFVVGGWGIEKGCDLTICRQNTWAEELVEGVWGLLCRDKFKARALGHFG